MEIRIKLLRDGAVLPRRATPGSAGADIHACIEDPVVIAPRSSAQIPSGFAVEVPEGYAAFVFARSGLSRKHGVAPVNGVGVVDSDYRGEVIVALTNHFDEPYTVTPGERVAQLVIMPVAAAEFVPADDLTDTDRGAGGFGSTGAY